VSSNTANLLYLITIVTFILALRDLSNPASARRGVQIGAAGMMLAVVVTWIRIGTTSWWAIALGMLLGGGSWQPLTVNERLGLQRQLARAEFLARTRSLRLNP